MCFTLLSFDLTKEQIEEIVMKDERTLKQLEGKNPNKVLSFLENNKFSRVKN
jgi:leucyl-tRNA synthetase